MTFHIVTHDLYFIHDSCVIKFKNISNLLLFRKYLLRKTSIFFFVSLKTINDTDIEWGFTS